MLVQIWVQAPLAQVGQIHYEKYDNMQIWGTSTWKGVRVFWMK